MQEISLSSTGISVQLILAVYVNGGGGGGVVCRFEEKDLTLRELDFTKLRKT